MWAVLISISVAILTAANGLGAASSSPTSTDCGARFEAVLSGKWQDIRATGDLVRMENSIRNQAKNIMEAETVPTSRGLKFNSQRQLYREEFFARRGGTSVTVSVVTSNSGRIRAFKLKAGEVTTYRCMGL
jgi:hypothetical protein